MRDSPVFDAVDGTVGTENGILDFVQNVGIDRLRGQIDLVTFGTFGLDVVLPEEALLLAHAGASGSGISALFVTPSTICAYQLY